MGFKGQLSIIFRQHYLTVHRHVIRRDKEAILWIVLRTDIQGKRKRGRTKTSWKDACRRYIKSTGLGAGEEMTQETRCIVEDDHSYQRQRYNRKSQGERI